jgi:signal transduction histidine kinase/DNA-binding response OmpR family regulator
MFFGQVLRRVPPDHVRQSAEEMRGEGRLVVAAGAAVLLVGWFVVLGNATDPWTWLPPLVVLAVGSGGIVLAQHRPSWGSAVLILAILAGTAAYLLSRADDNAAFFLIASVVAAGTLLGVAAALGVAVISTALLVYAAALPSAPLAPSVAESAGLLVWVGVVLAWALANPMHTALNWAWSSYLDAVKKTDELRDHQGELNRTLASLNETLYRLEIANQELARARAAAEEARQLKTEFAANISHELRTPLNLIIGFSEILMTSPVDRSGLGLPPEARADVDVIYRNAMHLSNLIDDVLDLSQVDAGRMGLNKERATLATIVAEAVSAIERLYRARGLDLAIEISEDLPSIFVDRTRIRQVLINLLNNAARFTPRGGATIRARAEGGNLVVEVEDTGVGIAPEDIPKVFEEFRQLDGTTRRPHDGSGLGLAICRRFVELHGGAIWATSERGKGTVFSFSLPLIENVASIPFRNQWDTWVRVPAPNDEAQKSVVLVNEDPRVERLFRRYLDGYQIVAVTEEEEALRLFGKQRIQGVILTSAPGRPLNDRLQRLREAPRNVPVVVCSLPSSVSVGESLGVADYLLKPISGERLLDVIGRVAKKAHTVLLVDDDPEMVRLLARIIRSRSHRYQVLRAYGGVAALSMLREHRPDVVVLDLVMPDVDGYTVLREMREEPTLRDVPVIAVTARSYEAETLAAGAIEITREGGLSVGELMACLKTSLDSITTPAGSDGLPTPAGVP